MGQAEAGAEQTFGWGALGAFIKTRREARGLRQEDVAERLSELAGRTYIQANVSAFEGGERLSRDPSIVPLLARVLGIAMDDVIGVLFGYAEPTDGSVPRPAFGELVDEDDTLDAESKRHLKSQYKLLRAASAYSRTHPGHDLVTDAEAEEARLAGERLAEKHLEDGA